MAAFFSSFNEDWTVAENMDFEQTPQSERGLETLNVPSRDASIKQLADSHSALDGPPETKVIPRLRIIEEELAIIMNGTAPPVGSVFELPIRGAEEEHCRIWRDLARKRTPLPVDSHSQKYFTLPSIKKKPRCHPPTHDNTFVAEAASSSSSSSIRDRHLGVYNVMNSHNPPVLPPPTAGPSVPLPPLMDILFATPEEAAKYLEYSFE